MASSMGRFGIGTTGLGPACNQVFNAYRDQLVQDYIDKREKARTAALSAPPTPSASMKPVNCIVKKLDPTEQQRRVIRLEAERKELEKELEQQRLAMEKLSLKRPAPVPHTPEKRTHTYGDGTVLKIQPMKHAKTYKEPPKVPKLDCEYLQMKLVNLLEEAQGEGYSSFFHESKSKTFQKSPSGPKPEATKEVSPKVYRDNNKSTRLLIARIRDLRKAHRSRWGESRIHYRHTLYTSNDLDDPESEYNGSPLEPKQN